MKPTLIRISNLQWLLTQLRLHALEFRHPELSFFPTLAERSNGTVLCCAWQGLTIDAFLALKNKKTAEIRLKEICLQRNQIIIDIADGIPTLKKVIGQKSIIHQFLQSYGMGSAEICRYMNGKFDWISKPLSVGSRPVKMNLNPSSDLLKEMELAEKKMKLHKKGRKNES